MYMYSLQIKRDSQKKKKFVPHRKHNTSPFFSQELRPLDRRGRHCYMLGVAIDGFELETGFIGLFDAHNSWPHFTDHYHTQADALSHAASNSGDSMAYHQLRVF
jgi:hypothetical protein